MLNSILALALALNPQAAPEPLAILHATVISSERDGPLPDATVLIAGGRIVSVGASAEVPVPDGFRPVDASGLFLSPGFVDAHVHLPGEGAEFPPEETERVLAAYLDAGVTTLRVPRGAPEHLELRARIERGELAGPRLVISTPPISGRSPLPVADAAARFAEWADAGYDFVKYLSGVPESEYVELVRLAREAGLDWTGHAPAGGLNAVLQSGQLGLEHASAIVRGTADLDADARKTLFESLGANGLFLCPNLLYYETLSDRPRLAQLRARPGLDDCPDSIVAAWVAEREQPDPSRASWTAIVERFDPLLPELRQAGVRIVISPSAGPFIAPGPSYVLEIRRLARAGMDPRSLFRSATIEGAACCRLEASIGTVEAGRLADLVLLTDDPSLDLDAYTAPSAVVHGGSWRAIAEHLQEPTETSAR